MAVEGIKPEPHLPCLSLANWASHDAVSPTFPDPPSFLPDISWCPPAHSLMSESMRKPKPNAGRVQNRSENANTLSNKQPHFQPHTHPSQMSSRWKDGLPVFHPCWQQQVPGFAFLTPHAFKWRSCDHKINLQYFKNCLEC